MNLHNVITHFTKGLSAYLVLEGLIRCCGLDLIIQTANEIHERIQKEEALHEGS